MSCHVSFYFNLNWHCCTLYCRKNEKNTHYVVITLGFSFSTVCRYQVGHLDVEEVVGVLVLADIGQSSGVRFILRQRADPAPVLVIKYSLKNR